MSDLLMRTAEHITALQNEVYRQNAVIDNQAKALGHWHRKSDQDAGEIARYRAALERVRQGYVNILEMRKLTADVWGTRNGYGGRYGALTREEVEGVIREIETALRPDHTPAADTEAL